MLIDAHVHLQEEAILDRLRTVMGDCAQEGVGLMICNGTRPSDWADVAAIAERYEQVVPCFGVHPWYVSEAGDLWEQELRDFLSRHSSAVGECGIDRWVEPRDEKRQEEVFRRHLQIAKEIGRPAMVHCLRAWGWLMEILETADRPDTMLIHSYGGSAELVPKLVAYGAFFSFSGNIFETKRKKLRDVVREIPPDRLLIETDAPAMLPPWGKQTETDLGDDPALAAALAATMGKKRYEVVTRAGEVQNHPANLPVVYDAIAGLVGCNAGDLRLQVKENARQFLGDLWDARR